METIVLFIWIVICLVLLVLCFVSARRGSVFYTVLFGANFLIVLAFILFAVIPSIKNDDKPPAVTTKSEIGEYRLAKEKGGMNYHIVRVRILPSGRYEIVKDLGKIDKK